MAELDYVRGRVHFGIITIRDDEYEAILARLPETSVVDGKDERRYRLTSLTCPDGAQVVVAVTRCIEQGNIEAQKTASDMVEDLAPQWVLIVGIAGGVPDSDFSLGDVVISSRVYDLTLEVAQPGGGREYSIKGGALHTLARRVVQDIPGMLSRELKGWHDTIDMKRPLQDLEGLDNLLTGDAEWNNRVKQSIHKHFSQSRTPIALTGAIASSDRLVKDTEITTSWKRIARNFLAIDMELAGVCRALEKIPVLGIRGISDIVGLQRDEAWTIYACKTAAAFAVSLIKCGLMTLASSISMNSGVKNFVTQNREKPFKSEGGLPLNWPSYIPRECDRELIQALATSQFIAISGEYQYGKTSLCNQIPSLQHDREICYIDLEGMRTEDVKLFTTEFFDEAGKFFGALRTWNDLTDCLRTCPTILCLDDLGALTQETARYLIPKLHKCAEDSGEGFRLVVSMRDPINVFLKRWGLLNPKFFRGCHSIIVKRFTRQDTIKLLNLLPGDIANILRQQLDIIMKQSSGRPQAIQALCERTFNHVGQTKSEIIALIDE